MRASPSPCPQPLLPLPIPPPPAELPVSRIQRLIHDGSLQELKERVATLEEEKREAYEFANEVIQVSDMLNER